MPRGDGTGPRGKGPGTGRGVGGCSRSAVGGTGALRALDSEFSGRSPGAASGSGATGRDGIPWLKMGEMLLRIFERISRK